MAWGWVFVEVHWMDITGTAEWTSTLHLPKLTRVIHRGWLVSEDEETITICGSYIDDEDEGEWTVGDVTTIPKSVIQGKVKKLNV